MKQKKIPLRMCVVTREKIEKRNLLRFVKTEDGVIVDPTGKVNGHGVYVKKDKDVIKKAKDNKIIDKALECSISDEVYDKALEVVENGN